MRVGIIGTGAISHKHAQAYANIGYQVTACTDFHAESGRAFADRYGCEFVASYEELCRHPNVDYVDVCTFPEFRLEPVTLCAEARKHIQVQKPMATSLETARKMIETACNAGIQLGVVSQHRFDDSTQFLRRALDEGRLGKILQADAYVKWYRSPAYYSRSIKGSWTTEGGGALITQAIHQLDILRWMAGPVAELFGMWQLGALHKIESEDVVNAVVRYASGATGVFQASTAFWPGYTERTPCSIYERHNDYGCSPGGTVSAVQPWLSLERESGFSGGAGVSQLDRMDVLDLAAVFEENQSCLGKRAVSLR